jgi:FkbM family methyltransferase
MSENAVQKVRFVRLKRFAGALIRQPLVGRAIGYAFRDRIPSRGLKINTSGKIDPWVKAYILLGMYESAEVSFINKYLDGNLDAVELGSSIGVVSCHISRKMKGPGRLICVEANPFLKERIVQNLQTKGFGSSNIKVISSAISYEEAGARSIPFHLGRSNLDSSVGGVGTPVLVPKTTLSAILADHGVKNYTLVMDIEGSEIEILKRDLRALSTCRQIIAELHATSFEGKTFSVESLIDIIVKDAGFALRARRGPVCVFQKS